jgi:hypothetical protein
VCVFSCERERRRETTVEALRSTKLKEKLKRFQSREKKKIGFRFEKDRMKEWSFVL